MPIRVGGHLVDEIDHAILKPANIKSVDDVHNQRPRRRAE
jgi:hypothetical protein